MHKTIRILFLACVVFLGHHAYSQRPLFSLTTDLGVQRSFKKGQQFWAVGHTVSTQFNFTPTDALYAWISYYSDGRFANNQLVATAKSALTIPQTVTYNNAATMRFKQLSFGWKKYLAGACNTETLNIYGYGGFGLILGRVDNRHSIAIDTNDYVVPVRTGKANFKRLTIDLGLGTEFHLGASTYVYVEGRAWLPTSGYPSKYLFANKNAPLVGMFNVGLRFLFD